MAREEHRREPEDGAGRVGLTPGGVVAEAISLADREGVGAVTVRRLAGELGVTPMALYWHFRSKDDLLDGMVGGIYEEIAPDLEGLVTWQEQLRELLGSMLEVLRAHPAMATLFAGRSVVCEDSLRVTEAILDILKRGGFSPVEATQIARNALSTVTNLVSGMPVAVSREEPGELLDSSRRMLVFLKSLPPERYPRLVEAAEPLSQCEDSDAYCAFGLDLLIGGIEAMAKR